MTKDTDKEPTAAIPDVNRYGTMSLYNKKVRVNVESRFTLFKMPHLISMTDNCITMNMFSSETSRVLSTRNVSIIRTGITLQVERLDEDYGYTVRFSIPQTLAENGVRFLCHVANESGMLNVIGRTQHPHFAHLFFASGFTIDNDVYPPSISIRDRGDTSLADRVQLRFAMIYHPDLICRGLGNGQKQPENIIVYHGEHIVTMTIETHHIPVCHHPNLLLMKGLIGQTITPNPIYQCAMPIDAGFTPPPGVDVDLVV